MSVTAFKYSCHEIRNDFYRYVFFRYARKQLIHARERMCGHGGWKKLHAVGPYSPDGQVPAYERSDQLRSLADPYEIVAGWSRLATEVSPRGSPVLLLVRDAALVDAGLRPLLADLQELRHQRMTENAEFLQTAGHLREGITREAAADLMWSVTAPEMYELLVLQRGWTLDQYRDYVFHTVAGLLARR